MARKPDSHHVLPLWCDDLIASCVDMTPACFGAYMRLLCYAWTRGSIPDDEAACSRIAGGLDDRDWNEIRSRLTETEDGRLTHQRLELERMAVAEIREKRAEAGRKGGKAKANGWQTSSKSVAPNPSPSLPYTEPEIQPAAPVPTSEPAKPSRSRAKSSMLWSADAGWQGISDADRSEWAAAFPAAVLDQELAKATAWLRANPKRAVRSNWRRFLVGWLQRCQDKGGTIREPGYRPDGIANQQRLERKAREFAEYQPAPYRRPKELAALANSLKLKEEDE
jgi:uncharacterized protein YdaU (DUF1376 family)